MTLDVFRGRKTTTQQQQHSRTITYHLEMQMEENNVNPKGAVWPQRNKTFHAQRS